MPFRPVLRKLCCGHAKNRDAESGGIKELEQRLGRQRFLSAAIPRDADNVNSWVKDIATNPDPRQRLLVDGRGNWVGCVGPSIRCRSHWSGRSIVRGRFRFPGNTAVCPIPCPRWLARIWALALRAQAVVAGRLLLTACPLDKARGRRSRILLVAIP